MIFMVLSVPLAPQAPWRQHRAAQMGAAQLIKSKSLKIGYKKICPRLSLKQGIIFIIVGNKTKQNKTKHCHLLQKETIKLSAILYTMIFERLIWNKGHGHSSHKMCRNIKDSWRIVLILLFFSVNLLMWWIIFMSFLILSHLCICPSWT